MKNIILTTIILISLAIIFLIASPYYAEGNEPLFFSDADTEELIMEYGAEQQIFDRITTSYKWNEEVMGNGLTPEEYKVGVTATVK